MNNSNLNKMKMKGINWHYWIWHTERTHTQNHNHTDMHTPNTTTKAHHLNTSIVTINPTLHNHTRTQFNRYNHNHVRTTTFSRRPASKSSPLHEVWRSDEWMTDALINNQLQALQVEWATRNIDTRRQRSQMNWTGQDRLSLGSKRIQIHKKKKNRIIEALHRNNFFV